MASTLIYYFNKAKQYLESYLANKCTEDDTKAAACRSPKLHKKTKKIKYGEERFSIWRIDFFHPAM